MRKYNVFKYKVQYELNIQILEYITSIDCK